MGMLARGEIDAYVSLDSFGAQERVVPVCKIGSSDYYFAVNKDRPDLLAELNSALMAIQDEDPYYNQHLFESYVQLTKTNAFLSPRLENWLTDHGTIRVGYLDNYLPFCAAVRETGALTGALKDFLAHASNCLKNAEVRFEAAPYPSTGAALDALKRGEIDCVFPINISTHQGETLGVLMVSSITKVRSAGIIYAHIAQALARGYEDLYYVNLETEQFIEYRIDEESGLLTEARRGWHFFEECQEEIEQFVYSEDLEAVKKALDRKNLVEALERNQIFVMTYRLNTEKGPSYVRVKISRMEDDNRYIILGLTDVDEEMKQRRAAARMKEEQVVYTRLRALTGDFLSIYLVVPETGRYREFSATASFENYARSREGMDFFADSREQSRTILYPEDQNHFLTMFTRENVLLDIERHGIFTLSYRLMLDGKPRYVQLKAALVEEKEGARLIVGISDIDAQVRHEEEYVKNLAQARIEASVDALTGVKNRHAYLMTEERLNTQIAEGQASEFAVVVLDVNDLKTVNDTEGHEAGDQYLQTACKTICDIFAHSPVFRIGGDEFAVIAQGQDYSRIEALIRKMRDHNARAMQTGGVVIACGMAKRQRDESLASVFERADHEMYTNKSDLKAAKRG